MQYVWNVGDTGPIERTVLVDATGQPVSLVGATVRLRVRHLQPDPATGVPPDPHIEAAGTLLDAQGGAVSYTLLAADTAHTAVGRYAAEWEVTDSAGAVKTYGTGPGGWIPVLIAPTLAVAP